VLKGWVAGPGLEAQQEQGCQRLGTWRSDHPRVEGSGALAGMSGRNCKLVVVKPEKRGGYMPDPLMSKSIAESQKRCVPIEEVTCPAWERMRT